MVKVHSHDELSARLEQMFSARRVISVSRAALGLAAVLRCWRGGRTSCRVALPGAVCHDVLVAVLSAGCEPIFCDVDADGLAQESQWQRARSLGADVAIVVHLYGNPARIAPVRALFPTPDCLLIDDAAQALGSRSQDGPSGALGDVGLLSFGMTKHISSGNAAVLFHDAGFAADVQAVLDTFSAQSASVRESINKAFRLRLDAARARLRSDGDSAASAFDGLLEGLEPTLYAEFDRGAARAVLAALDQYPQATQARIAKAHLWASHLAPLGFVSVGMGSGAVPWRYVCRLPGISWLQQYQLAEAMRAAPMHVSNWYLPAPWFIGRPRGTLPGVERLSREVFQFWLDGTVTSDSIVRQAAAVRDVVKGAAS